MPPLLTAVPLTVAPGPSLDYIHCHYSMQLLIALIHGYSVTPSLPFAGEFCHESTRRCCHLARATATLIGQDAPLGGRPLAPCVGRNDR